MPRPNVKTGALGCLPLLLLAVVPGAAEDPPNRSTGSAAETPADEPSADEVRPAEAAGEAQMGFSSGTGARIEVFGRAGLVALRVSSTDSFGFGAMAGADSPDQSVSLSRRSSQFGWGGGARLLYGNWGIEGSYGIFRSVDLTPGGVYRDLADEDSDNPELAADLPLVASRVDLLLAQGIGAFPLAGGSMELSFGLGAGWIRATDSTTDRFLEGAAFNLGLQPDAPLVPDFDFEADRSSIVYVGSMGLSFRLGRLLLRPRVDVVFGPTLTTSLTAGADLELGEEVDVPPLEVRWNSTLKPTILFFAVDIGLSS